MAVNEDFVLFVNEQLKDFGEFEMKRMFGGVGYFRDGLMFGKIGSATFYLKVDDKNKMDFEQKGMRPFFSKNKKKGMPYWEVPVEILENKSELSKWCGKAFEAAVRAKK